MIETLGDGFVKLDSEDLSTNESCLSLISCDLAIRLLKTRKVIEVEALHLGRKSTLSYRLESTFFFQLYSDRRKCFCTL